jgi:flagellar protein FlaG
MAMQPVSSVPPNAAVPRINDARQASAQADNLDETVNVVRPAPSSTAKTPAQAPSREEIAAAMQEMQKVLTPVARNLQFSIDEQTGKTIVKIMDTSTSEVIRQFPSEELLNIAHALDKFSGLLIKQKV